MIERTAAARQALTNRWFIGTGPEFPDAAGLALSNPVPDGSLFYRSDWHTLYWYDAAAQTWTALATGGGLADAPVDGTTYARKNAAWTPVAGVSVPTGTGFRHITAGAEDAASQLVGNVDVAAAAGIVETKLALSFPTHSSANDPSAGEKAALAGTSGVPGAGNAYVTDADARNSNARSPIAHAHAPTDVTGTAVITTDGRLSDSRTPTSHGNALHTTGVAAGASAPGDVAAEGANAAVARADHRHSREAFGVIAGTVCQGNDGRLSDARTPLAHSHVPGDVTGTAVITGDARLSDARTPTAHAASHVTGADQIGTFGAAARGLVPASGGGVANFLRADGTFASPGASSMPDLVPTKHVVGADTVIAAGTAVYVGRYAEIAAGFTLELAGNGDLEIG